MKASCQRRSGLLRLLPRRAAAARWWRRRAEEGCGEPALRPAHRQQGGRITPSRGPAARAGRRRPLREPGHWLSPPPSESARRCHQFAGGFDAEATALFARLHAALSSPAAAAAADDGAQDAGDGA